MRARALRDFHDASVRKIREKGEIFECTKERFAQLANSRWGALVEEVKKKKED